MAVPPYITVTYNPPLPSDTGAEFDAKAFDTVAKLNPWSTAANGLADYVNDRADNALAAALGGALPPLTDQALKLLRVNAGETAAEFVSAFDAVEPLKALTADAQAGTGDGVMDPVLTKAAIDAQVPGVLNATGTAPTYACRAWVNFNGTGTVAIRASGNVSSVTDNGTGDYTVNFATAMPDADYAVSIIGELVPFGAGSAGALYGEISSGRLTSSVRVGSQRADNASAVDRNHMHVAIFR